MADALGDTQIATPAVPLYANVIAAPVTDPDRIRELLVEQVTGMVRWRESIVEMVREGVSEFVEVGGKVLTPMVKRIAPDARATSIVTMEDVEAFARRSSAPA
jgi:[acyl-carrier-protein] S-malonyltransferase